MAGGWRLDDRALRQSGKIRVRRPHQPCRGVRHSLARLDASPETGHRRRGSAGGNSRARLDTRPAGGSSKSVLGSPRPNESAGRRCYRSAEDGESSGERESSAPRSGTHRPDLGTGLSCVSWSGRVRGPDHRNMEPYRSSPASLARDLGDRSNPAISGGRHSHRGATELHGRNGGGVPGRNGAGQLRCEHLLGASGRLLVHARVRSAAPGHIDCRPYRKRVHRPNRFDEGK